MPLRIPSRTRLCSTDSKCRGGKAWRAASVFAEIGRPGVCTATSMTAAIARSPLRGSRGMYWKKRHWRGIVRREVTYYTYTECLVYRQFRRRFIQSSFPIRWNQAHPWRALLHLDWSIQQVLHVELVRLLVARYACRAKRRIIRYQH